MAEEYSYMGRILYIYKSRTTTWWIDGSSVIVRDPIDRLVDHGIQYPVLGVDFLISFSHQQSSTRFFFRIYIDLQLQENMSTKLL